MTTQTKECSFCGGRGYLFTDFMGHTKFCPMCQTFSTWSVGRSSEEFHRKVRVPSKVEKVTEDEDGNLIITLKVPKEFSPVMKKYSLPVTQPCLHLCIEEVM